MANNNLAHRRTHNLLLISKLLNQHQHVSPLTLVLDTVEQSSRPLLREYLRRAKQLSKTTQTIFLSFETVDKLKRYNNNNNTNTDNSRNSSTNNIDEFITCFDKSPEQILQACRSARARAKARATGTGTGAGTGTDGGRCLVVIDSLTMLVGLSLSGSGFNLPAFLSLLMQTLSSSSSSSSSSSPSPTVSVVAVYHTDVHLADDAATKTDNYHPSPLSLLKYLATTIISVHSLPVLLAEKAAQERSLAAPAFGLDEEADGILVGLKEQRQQQQHRHHLQQGGAGVVKTLKAEERGIVLELEHRRKSGRGVHELYFLPSSCLSPSPKNNKINKENIILLDDHSRFRKDETGETDEGQQQQLAGLTTFELGLTERQRLERDGVVLPYFDAQGSGGGGSGSGGRILYDMGVEDDFDEEEDEI